MYEYQPKLSKQKERILTLLLGVSGVLLFAVSQIYGVPFPAFVQLFGVLLLGGAIIIASRYLLRDFCYTVAPRADASLDAPQDLTVTELCGKRRRVVCILSVAEILDATPCTAENKQMRRAQMSGATVYRYVASLWEGDVWLLEVRHDEMRFFLEIHADKRLISSILNR